MAVDMAASRPPVMPFGALSSLDLLAVRGAAVTTSAIAGLASTGSAVLAACASLGTVVMVVLSIVWANRRSRRDAAQDDRDRAQDVQDAFDRGWHMRGDVMRAPSVAPPAHDEGVV